MTAVSDRLLGMLVPKVVAHADPCGVRETRRCFCRGGREWLRRCCTVNNICGACFQGPYNC